MKKYLIFILSFSLMMTININSVYALKLNKNDIMMGTGSNVSLSVSGAASNNLKWTSTDDNIITVSNGKITAKSVGTAYISVTDGTGSDTCKVQVVNNYVAVSSITLSSTNATIKVGETKKISATVNPSNASNKKINYSSANANIARVDSSGNVTGVSAGSTYITVTAEDQSARFNVSVIKTSTNQNVKLNSISLPETYELTEGGSGKLTVTYNPTNASNKSVSWKSSDTKIVTVDSNGNLKAVASGSANITATSKDGNHTATTKVTVNAIDKTLKSISLDKTEVTLELGKTAKLTVNFNPNNAENKNVSWRSTNRNVVTVEDGLITAVKPGKAEIKVTSEAGDFQAICKVTVLSPPIDSLEFKNEVNEVFIGDTVILETVSVPENTMINDPIWTSSDETVATIAEDGSVTGVALGSTTITVSDKSGKVTATTTVNVIEKPDEKLVITVSGYNINFDPSQKTYDLSIGKEKELDISVNRDASKYVIGGNHDLKNGSVITITVYGDEKVTYMINIRKKEQFPIGFIIAISLLLIVNIIRLLIKNKKK